MNYCLWTPLPKLCSLRADPWGQTKQGYSSRACRKPPWPQTLALPQHHKVVEQLCLVISVVAQPAVNPQPPQYPVPWEEETVCSLFYCFFRRFFLAFNCKSSKPLCLQRAVRNFSIFSPCFSISCGCLMGISVGMCVQEGKTAQSTPRHKLQWVGERGAGWSRVSRCWLQGEPAGCAHEQEMRSSAAGMLRSKSRATGKKQLLFLQGFSPAHYNLRLLTAHKATRIWHLLNSVIKKKETMNWCFLVRKPIFLQLTLMHSEKFSAFYCLTLFFFFFECLLSSRGQHLSVSLIGTCTKYRYRVPEENSLFSWIFCVGPTVARTAASLV